MTYTMNYVVTAHRPTNVTHSLTAQFTGPTDMNLIIAKCTRIEVSEHGTPPRALRAARIVVHCTRRLSR